MYYHHLFHLFFIFGFVFYNYISLTTTNKRYYANNVGWVDPDVNKIWTYQDTAPIGWSIITGTSDSLLACKGGGQSYNTVGETQAGTWSQSGHYHSMGVHAHTTSSHTLTESDMPSHSNDYIDSISVITYIGDGFAIATVTLTTHRN